MVSKMEAPIFSKIKKYIQIEEYPFHTLNPQSPIPNPQSPTPNPQSPIPKLKK